MNAVSSKPPLGIPRAEPVRTVTPPAQVRADPIPAKMEIHTRAAEMSTDWRQVWDEFGLKRPSSFLQEIEGKIAAVFAEDFVTNVQQGDESADLRHPNKPNIFGRQAYSDYMRHSRVDVNIDVAPKTRVKFDIRIHAPEIDVQTRPIAGTKS